MDVTSAAIDAATREYARSALPSARSVVRLLAAHARDVAPTAVRMTFESSDQGPYMTLSGSRLLDAAGGSVAGADTPEGTPWQQRVNAEDLEDVAANLSYHYTGWSYLIDDAHPFTHRRNGYVALDLVRAVR